MHYTCTYNIRLTVAYRYRKAAIASADWKERLPLHTFLPSPTEVLLLFLAVVVVIVVVTVAVVVVPSHPVAAVTGATAVDVDGGHVTVSVPFAQRGVRGDRTISATWWRS